MIRHPILEGDPKGPAPLPLPLAVAVARFNQPVTDRLLQGALEACADHGIAAPAPRVARVPGAFELPLLSQQLIEAGAGAVVALGAVIRGDTPHFDFVANEAARGCGAVALRTGAPVVFGVLTTDTAEQAFARAGGVLGNKGYDAVVTALEMLSLARRLKDQG